MLKLVSAVSKSFTFGIITLLGKKKVIISDGTGNCAEMDRQDD